MDPAHAMDTKVLGGNEINAAALPFVVLIRIEKSGEYLMEEVIL